MEWTRPRSQTLCHKTESSGSSTLLQLLISGGIWERLVKSAKKALKITLNGQLVNDETLLTLMAEIESLLNSRPLTHVSIDPQDLEAITPNHFLIGRNSPNIPPDVFDERFEFQKAVETSPDTLLEKMVK